MGSWRTAVRHAHTAKNLTAQGGYVLADAVAKRQAILMATGSEVEIALKARDLLEAFLKKAVQVGDRHRAVVHGGFPRLRTGLWSGDGGGKTRWRMI